MAPGGPRHLTAIRKSRTYESLHMLSYYRPGQRLPRSGLRLHAYERCRYVQSMVQSEPFQVGVCPTSKKKTIGSKKMIRLRLMAHLLFTRCLNRPVSSSDILGLADQDQGYGRRARATSGCPDRIFNQTLAGCGVPSQILQSPWSRLTWNKSLNPRGLLRLVN